MYLVRQTAPSAAVVDLAAVKAHLRISHAAEDALLQALINAVNEQLDGLDGILRRALVTQTWRLFRRDFPAEAVWRLPLPPLQSVSSITYIDLAGATQTVSAADYHVIAPTGAAGWIELVDTKTWPAAVADRPDAVRVDFVAGYGAASAVPVPIKQAALLMVGELYANRGDVDAAPMPAGGQYLVTPHGAAIAALLSKYLWREIA